jgi:hypothetical protein
MADRDGEDFIELIHDAPRLVSGAILWIGRNSRHAVDAPQDVVSSLLARCSVSLRNCGEVRRG